MIKKTSILSDVQESIEELKIAISNNPFEMDNYIQIISIFHKNKQNNEAIAYIQEAEKLDKNHPLLLAHKAIVLLKMKRVEESYHTIQKSIELDNKSAFSLLVLANIFVMKKEIAKAKKALDFAIELDINFAEAYGLRSKIFLENRYKKEGIDDVIHALKLKPSLLSVLTPLVSPKNIQHSIKNIQSILHKLPKENSAPLLRKLAEYQYLGINLDDSIDTLKIALEIEPSSLETIKNIANLFFQKSKTEDAIKYYQKALSLGAKDIEILSNLALSYSKTEDKELATKYYKKALELNPNDKKVLFNFALFMKDANRFNEAIAIAQQLIELDDRNAKALFLLSSLWFNNNQIDKALEVAKKALTIDPFSSSIHQIIAWIYQDEGELKKAIEHYHLSLEYTLNDMEEKREFDVYQQEYMDKENAQLFLKKIHNALNKKDIEFFLAWGTLLGIMREGDILSHDKDMDIGMDWSVSRRLVKETLQEVGFTVDENSQYKDEWVLVVVDKELGISTDIFFHKRLNDKYITGFYAKPTPLNWEFSPFELREMEWMGYSWLIPSPYEQYLTEAYGEEWKTPDKAFDTVLSAKNLSKASKEISLCYGLSRLLKNIKQNNYKKAIGYCKQLTSLHNHPIIYRVERKMQEMERLFNRVKLDKKA